MQNTDETSFWEHEWEKHGTCACTDLYPNCQLEYFTGALNLRKKFDFDKKLAEAGITPSNTKSYTLDAIKSALGSAKYQCYVGNYDDDVQILEQIELCIDKDFEQQD